MEQVITILAVILSACTAARVPNRHSDTASVEVPYPQTISLDRFEAMLQRASQMLGRPTQVLDPEHHEQPTPPQYNTYNPREVSEATNYYLPIYHNEKPQKLDAKSRQLQFMMPPTEDNQESNFYVIKQKKLPKKFKNAAKQINVKVIAEAERGEVLPTTATAPQRHQGYSSNEHNIIFDDSFFGVDAQSAVPDEVPQEHNTEHGFIAPLYSRRNRKTEDLFATQSSRREARLRLGVPMTRFSILY